MGLTGVFFVVGALAAVVGLFGLFEANVGSRLIALLMTAPGLLMWLVTGGGLIIYAVAEREFMHALITGGVCSILFSPSLVGFYVAMRKAP